MSNKRGRPSEDEGVRTLKKDIQRIKHNVVRRYTRMIKKNPNMITAQEMIIKLKQISVKNIRSINSLESIRNKLIDESSKITSYSNKSSYIRESFKQLIKGSEFNKFMNQLDSSTAHKVMKIYSIFLEGNEYFFSYRYEIIELITENVYKGKNEDSILNNLRNNIDELYEEMQEALNEEDNNYYSSKMK